MHDIMRLILAYHVEHPWILDWLGSLALGVPALPEAAILRHPPGEAYEVLGTFEQAVLRAAVDRVLEAAVLGGSPKDGLLFAILAVEEVVVDVVLALVAVALLVDRVLDVGPEGG